MRKSIDQFAQAELKFSYKRAVNPVTITNGNEAYSYFKSIWDKELISIQEQVYVLFLNQAREVICWRCLHTGTMNDTPIDKRLLFGFACGCLASGVLLAHNHSSGNVTPSPADFTTTNELVKAANLLGLSFIDHLVIGNNQYYSFLSRRKVQGFAMAI